MPHPYLHLHVTHTERTNGRSVGTFQKSNGVSEIGDHCIEEYFQLVITGGVSGRYSGADVCIKLT